MPYLATKTAALEGMTVFGIMDLCSGFWQLPLHAACQEILSFATDSKVYTPNRVPQGAVDSALHFQSIMMKCVEDLLDKHVLIWMDDILIFARNQEEFMEVLEKVLEVVKRYRLKIHPEKTRLFLKEVYWCGRIYDGSGMRQDPERLQGLRDLRAPNTVGELQQFLCGVNWLRSAKLYYAVATAVVCLFTDASDYGWSVVITQVVEWDYSLPVEKQEHQALIFLSGSFKGAEFNWTVTEKEAFPIIMALEKASFLLHRIGGFRLYCDHLNLIQIFAPDKTTKKTSLGRLHRWYMKLLSFQYEIYHIAGELNVWADLLSRWIDKPETIKSLKRSKRVPKFVADQYSHIDPLGAGRMEMPPSDAIKETSMCFFFVG
jgi:hypothetical protein